MPCRTCRKTFAKNRYISISIFQFELLNIKDSKTILYLKKHHMIWDGMSDSVFLAKLERYYKNIDDSFDDEIPSYKDFSIKLERRKNSQRYKKDLEFWKSRLNLIQSS